MGCEASEHKIKCFRIPHWAPFKISAIWCKNDGLGVIKSNFVLTVANTNGGTHRRRKGSVFIQKLAILLEVRIAEHSAAGRPERASIGNPVIEE